MLMIETKTRGGQRRRCRGHPKNSPYRLKNLGYTCYLNATLQALSYGLSPIVFSQLLSLDLPAPRDLTTLPSSGEDKEKENRLKEEQKRNANIRVKKLVKDLFERVHGGAASQKTSGSITPKGEEWEEEGEGETVVDFKDKQTTKRILKAAETWEGESIVAGWDRHKGWEGGRGGRVVVKVKEINW